MDIKVTEDISSEYVEIVRDILEDEEFRKLSGIYPAPEDDTADPQPERILHFLENGQEAWM